MRQKLNPILQPLISPFRYKVLYGGRGSGKSWGVAQLLVEIAMRSKVRVFCGRELQNSMSDSVIKLIADTIEDLGYLADFEVQRNAIYCLKTGAEFMFYGIKNNPNKIKSLEGIDLVWIEEAENVSDESWNILIPTIRKEGSEIWITFNPKNLLDPTYQRFVINPPHNAFVQKVNFTENPYFPETLRLEMESCKERDFELYRHIWLGEPVADSDLAIIKPVWIESAVDAHKRLNFAASGRKIVGFDVADDGADANAICFAHGSVVLGLEEWRGEDVIKSALRTHSKAVEWQADEIVFDSIGVGAGVKAKYREIETNQINCIGFNAGAAVFNPDSFYTQGKKNGDMFANIKAQAWWQLRDRFYKTYRAIKYGDVYPVDEMISLSSDIPDLDYLKAELSRPRVDYDNNGKVRVESKKDMRKRGIPSPNKADALVMCFAPIRRDVLKQTALKLY